MKQIILFTMLLLLSACESKLACPVCKGEGSVNVYGEEQQCLTCRGEGKLSKEDYNTALNNLIRTRQMSPIQGGTGQSQGDMVPCPFCNGKGDNGSSSCGFCGGSGRVSAAAAAQGRHVIGGGSVQDFYPSSTSPSSGNKNSNSSADRSCHYCHGTGDCQHCKGIGLVEYESSYSLDQGVMKCPICKGTKRCNVCNGSGHI